MAYFVFSTYVNAWTLKKALGMLGHDLGCVAEKDGILPVSQAKPRANDTLFFTEEDSLAKYLGKNEFRFLPKTMKVPLDDKLAFSRMLRDLGERPVEFWESETPPSFPAVLKCRHSWKEGRKLPRGYVCRDQGEFDRARAAIAEQGLPAELFFVERFIPGRVSKNVSTSGFFDVQNERRNLIVATKKLLGDADHLATGTAIETIDGCDDLVQRTVTILRHMNYRGPFELEFLYDESNESYYVLELNPRFWMQHGIFLTAYENRLAKLYLEEDKEEDWFVGKTPYRPVVWLDAIQVLHAATKLDWTMLRLFCGSLLRAAFGKTKLALYPDLFSAVRFGLRRSGGRRATTN
jgi:hypothetical protein